MKVASVQTAPRLNDVEHNLDGICHSIHGLARAGVQLAVFPELATTGYMFSSRDEAEAVAERVHDGPTVRAVAEACRSTGMHVVLGMVERDGDQLFNSSVLVGPTGHLGTYRKLHLWDQENTIFTPGDRGLPVFRTPIGVVGMLICYDLWFPEAVRTLALAGAELVAVPTNWVPLPAGNGANDQAMANVLCMANAHTNGLPIVAADRCGTERDQLFLGRSLVVDHTGWPIAGPGSATSEEVLIAQLDLEIIPSARRWNTFNDPLANRRSDSYVMPPP